MYTLRIDNEANLYKIIKYTDKPRVIKSVVFEHGIKVREGNRATEIDFNPTGAPTNAGTINLSNRKGQKIEITITPATGSVNLYIN